MEGIPWGRVYFPNMITILSLIPHFPFFSVTWYFPHLVVNLCSLHSNLGGPCVWFNQKHHHGRSDSVLLPWLDQKMSCTAALFYEEACFRDSATILWDNPNWHILCNQTVHGQGILSYSQHQPLDMKGNLHSDCFKMCARFVLIEYGMIYRHGKDCQRKKLALTSP